MKEVYFLAKDPQADRFLMHKIIVNDDDKPECVGCCATIPDDSESDYETVMKVINAYRNSFENDLNGVRFYEGFALWAMDYFNKHSLSIGTPELELHMTIPGESRIKRYVWKREGELIKRVEIDPKEAT